MRRYSGGLQGKSYLSVRFVQIHPFLREGVSLGRSIVMVPDSEMEVDLEGMMRECISFLVNKKLIPSNRVIMLLHE